MTKDHTTLLHIGELARRIGVRTSVLRYYEEQGLITPADRTESGYRLYHPDDERTLRFIQRAQRLGFTLADIGVLLQGVRDGDLDNATIVKTAEARFLALEERITQLMIMRRELELFLRDMHRSTEQPRETGPFSLFNRLVDQVCADPLNQSAEVTFDWLLTRMGCVLTTEEGQGLLKQLHGQHIHIWQEHTTYHILVVSDEPTIGTALERLAQLEATCQAHTHTKQSPELRHDNEGYLLTAHGDNAFVFARLFLALERSGLMA